MPECPYRNVCTELCAGPSECYERASRDLRAAWGRDIRAMLAVPPPRVSGPYRVNRLDEFPRSQVTRRINAPGAGRPRTNTAPDVRRARQQEQQNARRAALKPEGLFICRDCGKPTDRRAGALRCYPCAKVRRRLVQNASRARGRGEAC